MPVPKRKLSKGKTRRKRNEKMQKDITVVIKTKDGKAFKRPHVEEYVDLD